MGQCGYAGSILEIDLATGRTSTREVSEYTDRFLGGRGMAARYYWDHTRPDTGAFDDGNCLVFATGPVAGFMGFSGCRWQVCGKSPQMVPEAFSCANLGGDWGAWLKYAGYDGLVVSGKSSTPVYVLLDDGRVELRDASPIWGRTTTDTEAILHAAFGQSTRVLSIGPAGEHRVTFATILASQNASGSAGLGSVMGSKNLKAVAIRVQDLKRPRAAHPDRLKELAKLVHRMRTTNFEDYGHLLPGKMKLSSCYGCISGCTRFTYRGEDGRIFKHFCQAAAVYMGPAMKYYGANKSAEANRLAGRLCDEYGLDTAVLSPMIAWLEQCYREGILNDRETGLPLSKVGSVEFIEALVKMLSLREGFGDILAQGVARAAEHIGRGSGQLSSAASLTRAGEAFDYDPRLILANAITYATEPRRAVNIHHATVLPLARWVNWTQNRWEDAFLSTDIMRDIAEKYWGGADAMDFSSYRGKALAAKQAQDYACIKESLILCDLVWPIYQVRDIDTDIGPGTLESRIVSAITGRDVDETVLFETGERTYNLQRAILIRDGWHGRSEDRLPDSLFTEPLKFTFFNPDCLVPGKDGMKVSLRGTVIDRAGFEMMKDEYYALRGWDVASGLQTTRRLARLGLDDVATELKRKGLLAE